MVCHQAVRIFLKQRFTNWRMCLNLFCLVLPATIFLLCLPEATNAGTEIIYGSAPQSVFADRFIYSLIANQVISAKKNGEKTLWPGSGVFNSEQRMDGDVSREPRLIIDDARNDIRIHLILNPARIKEVLPPSPGKNWAMAAVDNLLQSLLKLKESPATHPEDGETCQPMVTAAAGSGDDGDDEGENVGGSSIRLYYAAPSFTYQPEPVEWVSGEMAEQKMDLLRDILQRLDIALADGHRDLILILRDRLMIVLADIRDRYPLITSVILPPANHWLAQPDNTSPYLRQMQKIYHQASDILSSLNHNSGYARQTPTDKTNTANGQENIDNTVSDSAATGHPVTPSHSGESDNDPGDDSRNQKPENTEEEPQSLQVCEQCNTPLTEQNTVVARQKSTLQQQPLLCDDCWDYEESRGTPEEEVKSKNADARLLTEVTMENDQDNEDFSDSPKSYQQLIDDFLEIPVEDHLPLPEACRLNLFQNIKKGLELEGLEKARALLNKAVFKWIYKKDPDDARKEFLEVEVYANEYGIELSVFVKNWIGLWWYKQVVNGRNEYKARLIALLYNYGEEGNDDLISLQKLLTQGALIGFEDFADFEFSEPLTKSFNVFTAVSFTVVDQFRYCCFDEQIVDLTFLTHQNTKGIAFRNLLSNLIYFLVDEFTPNGEKYRKIIIDKFRQSNSFYELHLDQSWQLETLGEKDTSMPVNQKEYRMLLEFCRSPSFPKFNSKMLPIVYYDMVQTFMHQKALANKEKQQVGKYYRLLVEYYPSCRKGAYNWYKKVLMYDAAAREARALVEYWTPINVIFAHHWEEKYREADELSKQKTAKAKPASCDTSTYNIEEAIAAFDDAAPSFSQAHKSTRKSRKSRKSSKKAPIRTPEKAGQSKTAVTVEKVQEEKSPAIIVKRTVIPVGDKRHNLVDKSWLAKIPWHVQSRKGSLGPHERLLKKNWNSQIHKAIKDIKAHRQAANRDLELEVYRTFFNDDRARVMIGIERVWQEHAWTLMHEFDDSFDMGFLAESKQLAARKTAKIVKNKLLLPALALTLGMDEMNARISSQEVWERAQDLLARAEFQELEVSDEFRFRLRCLFSSMGHVYTLLAMSAPSTFKSQFEEKAKVWFGLKRIDTKWDRQRLSILK